MHGAVVAAQCRRTLPNEHPVVLAAVHGSLGLSGWRLFRGFTLLSPLSHSSPSLKGLLGSVDAKQQKSANHHYDSCVKVGSGDSHFNVSLIIVKDKVTRQCPQKWNRTKAPLCLPAYRLTARLNWLTKNQ